MRNEIALWNSEPELILEAEFDQFAAATETFPYWVVWQVPKNGHRVVHYFHMNDVRTVQIIGNDEEGDSKSDSITNKDAQPVAQT